MMEKYVRRQDDIHITIGRVFFLRIASIFALIYSLQQKVMHVGKSDL